MNNKIDIKSLVIGFLSAALLISVISFKNTSDEKEGRYKTTAVESRVVITDSQTGAFIISNDLGGIGKLKFNKGDFERIFQTDK